MVANGGGDADQARLELRKPENQAVRAHGPKSPEAAHWIEVRAVVARIAGDPALAAQLWLAAARFHVSDPRPNSHERRMCLDRAFHEWTNVKDNQVLGVLACQLRAMYENDPHHRPNVPDAIDRRLLRRGIPAVPVQQS